MARLKTGISDRSEPDPNDSGFYSGPMPPVANYRVSLKWLRIGLDKNGDQRWNGPMEISEEGKAKKYNGYTIWVGQSFTDHPRSKAYMMSLVTALGASWKDLLDRVVIDKADFSKEDPATVTKIGRVKIDGNELIVVTRSGKDQNGDPRLEPGSFLPADFEPEDDEEDDEDEDIDDEEDVDDEDDDEEDEEDDDEEDDEPAPPPRKSSARKSAKPAAKSTSRKRRAAAEDNEPPF